MAAYKAARRVTKCVNGVPVDYSATDKRITQVPEYSNINMNALYLSHSTLQPRTLDLVLQ